VWRRELTRVPVWTEGSGLKTGSKFACEGMKNKRTDRSADPVKEIIWPNSGGYHGSFRPPSLPYAHCALGEVNP
jgi:hypothetical protein